MKYEVHPTGSIQNAVVVPYVANIKLEFGVGVALTHVVLFLLIPAEDANLFNIGIKKATENRVSKRAGATGYQ